MMSLAPAYLDVVTTPFVKGSLEADMTISQLEASVNLKVGTRNQHLARSQLRCLDLSLNH